MFFPFMLFLLYGSVTYAEDCPVEKRVGDICYTRVAKTDTHQYGCIENCTYKKTFGIDSGLYCFKKGSLQVSECGGETPHEIGGNFLVTCGSGVVAPFCFQCGNTEAKCQGINPNSKCVIDDGKCLLRHNITCGSGEEIPYCFQCGKTSAECESFDCKLEGENLCVPRDINFDLQLFMDHAVELLESDTKTAVSPVRAPLVGGLVKHIVFYMLANFCMVVTRNVHWVRNAGDHI